MSINFFTIDLILIVILKDTSDISRNYENSCPITLNTRVTYDIFSISYTTITNISSMFLVSSWLKYLV